MVETDWREILSFSQREISPADKEKLCESLSWMEADDIELNFSDLKTLFRLAQDILKYKNEQVNNLMGKLESVNRKASKGKSKKVLHTGSPASTDSALETIAHQEDVIKANKEVLKQLYADIAELEGKKNKLEGDRNEDSDSSRDALSEMDAMVQLENDVAMKNRHIRKLLMDVNVLENENAGLKETVTVLQDKLLEATQVMDNLTEQIIGVKTECSQLKDILGKTKKENIELSCEIESLRKDLFEKESSRENIYEDIKSKVQHWKNIARTKKAELEALSIENERLKENLSHSSKQIPSPKTVNKDNKSQLEIYTKIKELQEKLIEASNEMVQSANLISILKAENRQLKSTIEDTPDHTIAENRNESDDGKQRLLINKLRKKVKSLSVTLQGTEEMVAIRERELAEIASELQLLQSDEGINSLLQGLKHKKQELKVKDEGIKSLVQEVNNMSQLVNDLQLENEALRQKYNIPIDEKISTDRIVMKYRNIEQNNADMCKEIRSLENKLVNVELQNRNLNGKVIKITKVMLSLGYDMSQLEKLMQTDDIDEKMPLDGGGEASAALEKQPNNTMFEENYKENKVTNYEEDMKMLAEENEGLRKGLQEMLDFLKDNSTSSSGILSLQCPSLEALLRSMEARHAAGWFAPHMATIMELRAAMGGKDALLTALHEARKETFDIMHQLSKETKKSSELERKIQELESIHQRKENDVIVPATNSYEFGTWISEDDQKPIDVINNGHDIEVMIDKGNRIYEGQLKKSLEYFHEKFKTLYDKISNMAIQAADDSNKWSIQEEQYKAQIETLKGQIQQQEDEDISDNSPGLISIPNSIHLQRKCTYLEETYRYIRTLNENIKNENMDVKKQMMTMSSEYEAEIQRLILAINNLTDKLRSSVPIELFWKQSSICNENILKYRNVIETGIQNKNEKIDLEQRLEQDKLDLINNFQKQITDAKAKSGMINIENVLANIEETVLRKQIQGLCKEIDTKSKKIEYLEKRNAELQNTQCSIIDTSLASITKEEENLMKTQLNNLADDNKNLKEQCRHVSSQLDIALLQLQEYQQRQMSNDIEINLLRHQILDLQSSSDNKAIVARLGGEVLVAHLQASESNKKIERLNSALSKEKDLRIEAEEMFKARQKIFDVYSFRYESKFKYVFEVMQVLRQQYQGSIPLASVENYLNAIENVSRETKAMNEKLQDIEDLRSSLMAKHSVFDQILNISKDNCVVDQNTCSHKLNAIVMESIQTRELEHIKKKLEILEQSREELIKHCNHLDRTLVLVNQGFEMSSMNGVARQHSVGEVNISMELEDIQSDDDSSSRKSKTITLPKPQVLKKLEIKNGDKINEVNKLKPQNGDTKNGNKYEVKEVIQENIIGSPIKTNTRINVSNVLIQTISFERETNSISTQTIDDNEIIKVNSKIETLLKEKEKYQRELSETLSVIQQRNKDNLVLNADKINLEAKIQSINSNCYKKDKIIEQLRDEVHELRNELDRFRTERLLETNKKRETLTEDTKYLLETLKQLEKDKNIIAAEYKELLNNEREEYSKTIKEMNVKMMEMQSKMDRKGSDLNGTNAEALKEVVNKYTMKMVELEDKSFKLQSELDECKTEITTYQSEIDRWKELATERLVKMEQFNSQLEERHCHEVESYKAENQHWLTQLNETQREQMELRTRLSEHKAMHIKQLAEKDAQIEQMRSVNQSLKAQVMNLQTMISVHDPSFDLSAIVEVEEAGDNISQQGSDRLEIKYESSGDLNELSEEFGRIGNASTSIWQEPVIERLRRDKQLVGKQNAILRRQIKALAARERRSRLDAQNLKNQVFRISSSGTRVATAESAALQNKIASLQAQLTSARRDTHSSIALWDKWKRAQQSADRWQMRYEEKCQEVKKLDASLQLAKSAMSRLEREKRMLMNRMAEIKGESQLSIEKQESETPEKVQRSIENGEIEDRLEVPSHRALMERVENQQRRIVALQLAERGNEHLVSEYEKALAEITSLKGQVLKLESTLLEAQIRSPINTASDPLPELEYWKNYCEMLKQENVSLTHRAAALDAAPASLHQHRINDLEQTVLTLRGLVSKLQAEQKSTATIPKRVDSRPNSGRSSEKGPARLESHRIEIANLKRSIQDKDLLLERSKEMLKIAAEREDELLRENAYLRRQLNDLTKPKEGFLSA